MNGYVLFEVAIEMSKPERIKPNVQGTYIYTPYIKKYALVRYEEYFRSAFRCQYVIAHNSKLTDDQLAKTFMGRVVKKSEKWINKYLEFEDDESALLWWKLNNY